MEYWIVFNQIIPIITNKMLTFIVFIYNIQNINSYVQWGFSNMFSTMYGLIMNKLTNRNKLIL